MSQSARESNTDRPVPLRITRQRKNKERKTRTDVQFAVGTKRKPYLLHVVDSKRLPTSQTSKYFMRQASFLNQKAKSDVWLAAPQTP